MLQHERGDLILVGMQRENITVIGDIVDAALCVLGIQHGNMIGGYADVTVEKMGPLCDENPFERMAK